MEQSLRLASVESNGHLIWKIESYYYNYSEHKATAILACFPLGEVRLQDVSLSLHHGGWDWEGHSPLTVLCGDAWRI